MYQRRFSPQERRILTVLIILFIASASVTGYLVYHTVKQAYGSLRGSLNPFAPKAETEAEASQHFIAGLPELHQPMQDEGPAPQPWDGVSRLNLLLIGLDYRDWVANEGPPRSDTMILLTLDPQNRSAGMLSIPRDLWVEIPGYGYHKINQAYQYGELYDYPGGGPALAMKTVEDFLGVPVPYYLRVDFGTFVRFIDLLGGVKLNVPERIEVDPLGDNNNTVLEPGVQTLPGEIALAYARARNTPGADFDRAQRQQQVILAIRQRILDFDLLPNLIAKAPQLYAELASGIKSNLTLFQCIQAAWVAQQIPAENITRAAIGPEQVVITTSWDGLSILQPIPEEVLKVRDQVFNQPVPAPQSGGTDSLSLMQMEQASVVIFNGTAIPGLASRTSEYFASQGVNVVEIGNADQFYSQTLVVDYTGKPYTLSYFAEVMNLSPERIQQQFDPNSAYDVAVFLGEDWATDNPLP